MDYNKDDIVLILDEGEWYGLYGIVEGFINDMPYVFCIQKPCYRYIITEKVKEFILKVRLG